MSGWIEANPMLLRGGAVLAVFAVMAIAEAAVEARPRRVARRSRWLHNVALTLLNTAVLRLLFPAGAVAAAAWSADRGFGFLHLVTWPAAAEAVLAIVALDLAIYGQHVLFHAVPALFRIHRVHHADIDFDVTLGTRFHPVEMVLSMLIKLAAVAVLGASVPAVIVFETVLAVTSIFNHANVRLPLAVERVLRCFLVTPAMHSVHHSADRSDRDTNFGFSIPWWDHLFGTYRERPARERAAIGVPELQFETRQTLRWMLALPYRSTAARVARGGERYEERAANRSPHPPSRSSAGILMSPRVWVALFTRR